MRYFPRVRSKNHSLDGIRRSQKGLTSLPVRSVIRFGSMTPTSKVFPKYFGKVDIVEINTVESVKRSRSKLMMKQAFDEAKVNHPEWYTVKSPSTLRKSGKGDDISYKDLPYPVVVKRIVGARAVGMELINSDKEYQKWANTVDTSRYYVEKYYSYSKEYRLHCTKDGCFYTCRKMLKENAEVRWYRNDSNCVWYLESNEKFNKPTTWDKLEKQCVKALEQVGLDVGAFDVRFQGSDKKEPKFILIEVNSAPSFGELTEQHYKEVLPQLIMNKYHARN